MRSTHLALAVLVLLAGTAALPSPAAAHRIELAGRVTASRTVLAQRRVGEPRYVAISDLFYRGRSAFLEVLDLTTRSVIQVTAKRSLFERRFGGARGAHIAPLGEIATYRDGVIGLAIAEAAVGGPRRYWYAELDAATGKLVRSTELATIRDGEELAIVGAEPAGGAAWFAITRRAARGRSLALYRLDLGAGAIASLDSLDGREVQRIALAPRSDAGREHSVRVHASADFARFAIVEYVEDGAAMAPGHIYIAEPSAGAVFAVPAPPAAYGVAFSGDGKYVYVASAQRGTIARIDLAAGKIDKQVAGPRFVHHLVISAGGTKLFALASSASYAVYDLPDLRSRADAAHPPGVLSAMSELHGNGVASLDGAFFVAPEAEDPRKPQSDERTYVIARLVD